MAPQNDQHEDQTDDVDLGITDEDAERLLNDPDDNRGSTAGRGKSRRDRDADADVDEPDDDDDDETGLGVRGRRALEAEKQRRKAARAELTSTRQKLEAAQRELEKLQSGNKSELQRLIDERDALKDQLGQVSSQARRRDVAEEFAPEHATAKQIRLVSKYITGSTDEELEASAEELFAQFAPADPPKPRTPARPKERLRGGADPEQEDDESDPRKLAEMIRRNR